MSGTRVRRISYANITSTLALVIALSSGGAYAAGKIGSKDIRVNAVKSKHIAKGGVKPADLRKAAVRSGKIAPGAVLSSHLAPGSVNSSHLAPGVVSNDIAVGSVDTQHLVDGAVLGTKIGNLAVTSGKLASNAVTGAKIADGAVTGQDIGTNTVGTGNLAPAAVTAPKLGVVHQRDNAVTVPAGTSVYNASVSCNPGEKLLAGGGNAPNNVSSGVAESYPDFASRTWHVRFYNTSASAQTYVVTALCLSAVN